MAAIARKVHTERLLSDLGTLGWTPGLTPESYERIANAGFRSGNAAKAAVIAEIALDSRPVTLRGLFYRCVSAGLYPSTDKCHYDSIKRLTAELRKSGIMPYQWLVDSLRSTEKPSSWSGLQDFAETVRGAYRKDFWHHLPWYVHVFSEKDAIAGTISPVTREYDVALSPIRGNTSLSFAHEIGSQWAEIEKPIFAAYLGDFDPNGMDIERDLKKKLSDHSGREVVEWRDVHSEWLDVHDETIADLPPGLIYWHRLGVNESDFDQFNLIRLAAKRTDSRYQKFAAKHGDDCAEVDALDPNELRRRVRESIEQFIPRDEWDRLCEVEKLEQETFVNALACLGPTGVTA